MDRGASAGQARWRRLGGREGRDATYAAYFWDTRLYVHAGSHQIAITGSPTPDALPAKIRAEVSGLGKAIVARLKG